MELVPKEYQIIRQELPKTKTYLGFKVVDAFRELKSSIISGILDKSLFWGVELDISGQVDKLWETISLLSSTEINIMNPNISNIIWKSYEIKSKIVDTLSQKEKSKINFFNYQILRNHLIHIIAIISLSNKAKIPKLITWNKKTPLNIKNYTDRIFRTNLDYLQDIVTISDSREIYIPLNEIDRALWDTSDASKSRNHFIFWLSWVLEFEKRNKNKQYCKARSVPNIPDKCKRYVVWPIWQIIFRIIEKKNPGSNLKNAVTSLYKLFRTNFAANKKTTRIPYLIHAGMLIIGSIPPIDFSIVPIVKTDSILMAVMNCNQLYKKICDQKKIESIQGKESDVENDIPNKPILYVPIIKKTNE